MYNAFLQKMEGDFESLRLNPSIIQSAAEPTQRHPLKAYDAIQLSGGVEFSAHFKREGFSPTFVTSDKTLLKAAQAEGLITDNPMNHAEID